MSSKKNKKRPVESDSDSDVEVEREVKVKETEPKSWADMAPGDIDRLTGQLSTKCAGYQDAAITLEENKDDALSATAAVFAKIIQSASCLHLMSRVIVHDVWLSFDEGPKEWSFGLVGGLIKTKDGWCSTIVKLVPFLEKFRKIHEIVKKADLLEPGQALVFDVVDNACRIEEEEEEDEEENSEDK